MTRILEAEQVAQDVGHRDALGADAGAGDDQIVGAGLEILPGLHAGALVHHRHAGVGVGAADPVELHRVELRVRVIAQQWLERNAALRRADMQAVLVRDIGDVVGHHQAAAARHVAHDHLRIAGDVLADMTRNQPRIDVVAAAGGEADIERDGLVLVELRRALREGRPGGRHARTPRTDATRAAWIMISFSPERLTRRLIRRRYRRKPPPVCDRRRIDSSVTLSLRPR